MKPLSPPRPPFPATHAVSVVRRLSPWLPVDALNLSYKRARKENTWLRIRRWTLEIDWCVYVEDDLDASGLSDYLRSRMVEAGQAIEDVKERKREMEGRSKCEMATCGICNPKQGGFGYWLRHEDLGR